MRLLRATAPIHILTALLALPACDFDSELSPRMALDVVVGSEIGGGTTNDLNYAIELERCRVAIETVEFTTSGEKHARRSPLQSLYDLAVPTAMAHPGHYAGGEVVGELNGRFVFDWRNDGELIGTADMLQAEYNGANFTFTQARIGDGIEPSDPIIGHTFDIAGTAVLDGEVITFEAFLDEDEGRRVVGLPFDLVVDDDSDETIALTLSVRDPFEGDTAFDGIDFLSLDDDGDGHVVLEPDTEGYNRLKRNLQAHDYYGAEVR